MVFKPLGLPKCSFLPVIIIALSPSHILINLAHSTFCCWNYVLVLMSFHQKQIISRWRNHDAKPSIGIGVIVSINSSKSVSCPKIWHFLPQMVAYHSGKIYMFKRISFSYSRPAITSFWQPKRNDIPTGLPILKWDGCPYILVVRISNAFEYLRATNQGGNQVQTRSSSRLIR